MPFGTITSQAVNYEPRSAGEYHKSTLGFNDPKDYFRIRGGSLRKDGLRSTGITRSLEKDVTVDGDTVRVRADVITNIVVPDGGHFTAAEIVSLLTDSSNFATVDTIDRSLLGES